MSTAGPAAHLRRATPDDLEAVVAIKRALPMPRARETQRGGFLLGSDPSTYRQLLHLGRAWLLELEGRPVGFSLALEDPALRASPLWSRRPLIEWVPDFDPDALVERRIAYFDQLAVLPGVRDRYWGAALAMRALADLIDARGHELVLTTTVVEPVCNRAALPYLARVGARRVGRLDEDYPEVGPVVSALHLIDAPRYRAALTRLRAQGPATREILAMSLGPTPAAPGAP